MMNKKAEYHKGRILLLLLVMAFLPMFSSFSAEETAAPIEVGVAWEGKSAMPERVLAGVQETLRQQAPQILLDIRKELKSLEALETVINDFEKSKKAMIILRSSGAKLLGRMGAAIPAFIGAANDPVALGVAERLDSPKPNITGVTYHLPALRKLESFKVIYPKMRGVLLLVEAGHPGAEIDASETEAAARVLGMDLRVVYCRTRDDLVAAAGLAGEDEAILLGVQSLITEQADAVVRAAGSHIVFGLGEQSVENGALAGIVTDDKKLGHMLGLMLIDHLVHGKPVSQIPIQTDPDPRILFNYASLENHKERLPMAIYHMAKSLQMLESILEGAPSGIAVAANREWLQINDYILDLTGYSREELIGINTRMLYPTEEEYEYVGKVYQRATEEGTSEVESRWLRKDGAIRHVLIRLTPLDRLDLTKGVTVTVLDITDRKRAEDRFAKAFSSSPAALVVSEIASGRFIDVNSRWEQMLGYSKEEQVGRTSMEVGIFSDPGDRDRIVAKLRAQGSFKDEPVRLVAKSGQYRFVLWSGEAITIEGRDVLLSLIQDETARRQAEEALAARNRIFLVGVGLFCLTLLYLILRLSASLKRERTGARELATEQRRLRSIAGNVPGVVYQFYATLAGEYGMNYLSERAAEVFGSDTVSDLDAFFPAFVGHVHPDDREAFMASIHDAVAAQAPWHCEFRFVKHSGEVVWFSGVSNPSVAPDRIIFDGLIFDITERKGSEEALRESEQRYRELVTHANSVILRMDTQGSITFFNVFAQRLFGYTVDEVLGRNVVGTIVPETDSAGNDLRGMILDIARHPSLYVQNENENMRRDGSRVWISWTNTPVINTAGEIVEILCIGNDITERRLAEEALRESEERFSKAFKSSPASLVISDIDTGLFIDVNDRWNEMLEFSREEQIGRTSMEIGIWADPKERTRIVAKLKEHGSFWDEAIRFKTKTGKIILGRWSGERVSLGGREVMLSQIYDETERREAEEALRKRENVLQRVFEILPVGLWFADKEGNLLRGNPAGVRIWGGEPHISISEYWIFQAWRLPSHEPVQPDGWALAKTIRTGATIIDEMLEIETFDGKRKIILNSTAPLLDDSGSIEGAIVVNMDITERSSLEEQLRQAQKMESVGRLAGGVAHDFNNMLGVILGHAEMVMKQLDPSNPLLSDIEEIQKAATRSADLTRQLLAFARKQTVAPKVIDLNETVSGMLKLLRRLIGEDIDLAWLPGKDPWLVRMDPAQIDQILANLCVNARDAINGLGKVTIETNNAAFDEDYRARDAGFIPGEYVLLAVSDDGCGMEAETLSNLFEPFFTTKELGRGTGLGLASVYGVVKQNNGFINVYSEPDRGTTFKIYLPRHAAKVEPAVQEPKPLAAARGSETILLVEDEPMILEVTTRMLEMLGYNLLSAYTPGEAIHLAQEHSGHIDLLMTDVIMPEMNGRELANKLRSIYPGVRLLFMSGYTANVIAHHGVLDEGVYFIQKPFSMTDLGTKIREVLEC